MAKVHPLLTFNSTGDASSSSTSTPNNKYLTSKRETFTIWMKSLVIQGSGCTAFDENGEIVYRVNNYDSKHSSEVYLMDLHGKLLYLPYVRRKCVVFQVGRATKAMVSVPASHCFE